MPSLPETAWFEQVPDWICEVLSPNTASGDRAEKLPIYAEQGVSHVWLIDPSLRTLEAFENNNGRWLLLATLKDVDPVSLPPFDAITFDLSLLWVD
jgi:Uma2 family endonuclease